MARFFAGAGGAGLAARFARELEMNSRTVTKEVWAKATTDAMKNGKDPAIVVVMGEGNSKVRLAIIEMSILEDLVEE